MRGASNTPLIGLILRFWLIASVVLLTFIAASADTPTQTDVITTAQPKHVTSSQELNVELPSAPEIAEAPQTAKPVLIKNKIIATPAPSIKVTVEGERMDQAHVFKNEQGALFVRAEQIFESLNDDYEFDAEQGALIVRRSQDGVVMELYTDTGIIKSDGKAIGKLRVFGEITPESISLTPNAIAVLAGAKPKLDKLTGNLTFELDARLRVASGFQLYVDDIPLGNVQPAAKSVGPVLLLPLLPIAKELGHSVDASSDYSTVTVRRAQDSAVFELNLTTGLVKRGGRPIGVSKDVTYIDAVNLLLPVSAMETLTGTHITVVPGTDRVDINLDDRLTGAIKPGQRVDEEAENEPFTVEELKFHTGIDTNNTVELGFRVKKFNGRLRYSSPDLPTTAAELEPDWLSIEYNHLDGAYGAIGDYAADKRELDGVGLRRIRGASIAKVVDNGRWSLAAGAPASGAKRISDDQTRIEYSGFAAGARYASAKGWEAGVSYKSDGISDDQMAVLSAISGKLGRITGEDDKLSWDAAGDIGLFKGEARQKSLDVRLNGGVRYDLNKTIDVDIYAAYEGSEFQRSTLSQENVETTIIESEQNQQDAAETESIPDIRVTGQDTLSIGGSVQISPERDFGLLTSPGASVFARHSLGGVAEGAQNGTKLNSYGITGSTGIANTGMNVTFDYSAYNQSFEADPSKDEGGNSFNVRAHKDFDKVKLRVQYNSAQIGDADRSERLSASAGIAAYNFQGPKEASLSIAPSINASWSQGSSTVNGGFIANANSGVVFGPKTRVQASLGVLQSFGAQQRADKFFTASIARKLKLNDNLALSLSYRNDLEGEQRFGLQLDGVYGFNDRRKYSSTNDGAGVLTGQAYLDKNRDGERQEDEPGIGGVIVNAKGAGRKLALRSDGQGFFTIQNITEGIHEIGLDNRSLPIGYSLADNAATRVTISDGRITKINLPIVQRGQIRGFAFIDDNGDGAYEKGEQRLEGARLRVRHSQDQELEFETISTSFGQYAFDDLPVGSYNIEIVETNAPNSAPGGVIAVELTPENDLMARVSLAALSAPRSQIVKLTEDPPPNKQAERAQELAPAPPP